MSLVRIIVLVALVALIAAAAGLDLEPLSRRAFPNDIAGVWELQSEPSALCPTTVTHTTWSAGGDGSFRAPHNTILHDATRCDGSPGEAFTFYPSSLLGGASGDASAAVPAALVEIMASATFNKAAKAALDAYGEEYLVGYEGGGRFCSGSKFEAQTTAFLIRPWLGGVDVPGVDVPIVSTYKYLVMVPRFQGAACVYRAAARAGDELDGSPEASVEADASPEAEAGQERCIQACMTLFP